ncbi:ATP-binding protein [Acetobacterium wieringae]|uniref:ATP-binding protein n=1 Tax=Acetobacterium wieringae TaxID=52694 RepID=UPI00315853EB
MTDLINIAEISQSCNIVDPNDYVKDGLVHCHKCNTPKQVTLSFADITRTVYCICECEKAIRDNKVYEFSVQQEKENISRLQTVGIQDDAYRKWTFAMDDGQQPNMEIAHIYADCFMDDFFKTGSGFLFWGDVGRGKTFAAACIANQLIENSIPVMMTSFAKIVDEVFSIKDKAEYFREFSRYKLLVIDDLGAERDTDYAMEQVYKVIDDRYKNNLPMIVTTNLGVSELKKPKEIKYSRIYDRILEKCTPIEFRGKNYREEKRNDQMEWAKEKFRK